MKRTIQFRFYNQRLNLGVVDIKQVYQLGPEPIRLHPEVYRGKLVYRAKGSSHRISYDQLKRG